MGNRKIAETAYGILEDKKARDIEIIDISEVSILADYFIICSGTSTTHIKTLADELEKRWARPATTSSTGKVTRVQGGSCWISGNWSYIYSTRKTASSTTLSGCGPRAG